MARLRPAGVCPEHPAAVRQRAGRGAVAAGRRILVARPADGQLADQDFTGKHDQNGAVFPAEQDGNYAWSAAFIDYVMRMAGAGHRFPYSANPCRLYQRRPAALARDSQFGHRRRAAGALCAAARRPDLHVARPASLSASTICRPAGFPAIATSSSRLVPGRARRDRRQCGQLGRDEARAGGGGRPARRPGRQRSSIPITRGSS